MEIAKELETSTTPKAANLPSDLPRPDQVYQLQGKQLVSERRDLSSDSWAIATQHPREQIALVRNGRLAGKKVLTFKNEQQELDPIDMPQVERRAIINNSDILAVLPND